MSVVRAAIKAALSRGFSSALTSPSLRQWRRDWQRGWRRLTGRVPEVHYFHQSDDPYSYLAASQLPALQSRYAVRLITHIVPPPDAAAAPEAERLRAWSERDAARLASSMGVPPRPQPPYPVLPMPDTHTLEGADLRKRLGHYLGATFYFEGEWYWGIDRLHYLEKRLHESGLAHPETSIHPLIPARALSFSPPTSPARRRPQLHFYLSFRSPYTYLAARQVRALAQHYSADLHLRFVLPMAMRGLPVPLEKRLYIVRDTKREAERLGIPFGCIVDPVGLPTERGLALLHHAIAKDKGPALAESFLQGVFADGIDAGSDSGLLHIAQRAGLGRSDIDAALADSSWRAIAEANRTDMLERGIWGVPSIRVDDRPVLWGQDRLWMVEEDLLAALNND